PRAPPAGPRSPRAEQSLSPFPVELGHRPEHPDGWPVSAPCLDPNRPFLPEPLGTLDEGEQHETKTLAIHKGHGPFTEQGHLGRRPGADAGPDLSGNVQEGGGNETQPQPARTD